jgi:transposase
MQAVRLLFQGLNPAFVADAVLRNRKTIYRWVNLKNEGGIHALLHLKSFIDNHT